MKNKTNFAILMMILSALGFAAMAVFVKFAGDLPSTQKSIFRAMVTFIISGTLLFKSLKNQKNKFQIIKKSINNYRALLIRVVAGTLGIILNYYAIDHLNLSDASIINKFSSVIVILLCFVFLKEKITKTQLIATFLAFVGVILIIKPEFSSEIIPYLVALAGTTSAAIAYTALRALRNTTNPNVIVFAFSLATNIILLPIVLIQFVPMTTMQVFYLVLAGLCAGVGQYGLTLSYKYAPASQVAIYSYYGVVFSAIFGMVLFHQFPDALSYAGYLIIFISSYILHKSQLTH